VHTATLPPEAPHAHTAPGSHQPQRLRTGWRGRRGLAPARQAHPGRSLPQAVPTQRPEAASRTRPTALR